MLLVGAAVVVGILHIGDKEVVLPIQGVFLRMEGGVEGVGPGVGNGAHRKAAAVIGVVGGEDLLGGVVIIGGTDVVIDIIIGGAGFQPGILGAARRLVNTEETLYISSTLADSFWMMEAKMASSSREYPAFSIAARFSEVQIRFSKLRSIRRMTESTSSSA